MSNSQNAPHTPQVGMTYIAQSGDTRYEVTRAGANSVTVYVTVKNHDTGDWMPVNDRGHFYNHHVQAQLDAGNWRLLPQSWGTR